MSFIIEAGKKLLGELNTGMNDAAKGEYVNLVGATGGDSPASREWNAMSDSEKVAEAKSRVTHNTSSNNSGSKNNTTTTPSEPDYEDPQERLATISRDALDNYLAKYGQTETDLVSDTTSTAIIDAAREAQQLGQATSVGVQQRSLGRYGAQMTPAQMAATQRATSLGQSASYAGAMNNAVLDQRDRNFALTTGLLGIGNDQLKTAMGDLATAAGLASDREAQYQRDKASAHASNMNLLGSIFGLGLA